MWMTATAEVMAITGAMTATTAENPIFISLAMAMAGAATPNIIAIEELRVVALDTPVAADMVGTEAVGTAVAMVEAEDGIESHNS
jgi:hypothetical protein